MYQVLLVDDEPSITASLQKSIDWAAHKCTVAAIATNGLQALSLLRHEQIDIVITDIRMQQMSGLELCQILYTQYPRIQIIVISGYAEFSYAQKAIRYGILGYCLKPLEYGEINSYLNRAVSRLEAASKIYSQDDLLHALLDEDTVLLSSFLKASGNYHDMWYCSVFSGICPPDTEDSSAVLVRLGKKQYGCFSPQPAAPSVISKFLSMPENRCAGLSPVPVTLDKLPSCMKECQIRALQYFIQPDRTVCTELFEGESQALLSQISSCLSAANSGQLIHVLEEIRLAITQKSSPQGNSFSVRTAMRLNNMICSSALYNSWEDDYYLYSVTQMLERYQNFSVLLDTLCRLILEPNAPFSEGKELSNGNFIRMIEFLNQNYAQDISTNDLAQYMHLNPGYLSKIFKRETGTTVTKYITSLRILKSKQMLDSGNYSISEIAAATGFNDYFYFLKTFKKVTGLTPKQYQMGEKPQ